MVMTIITWIIIGGLAGWIASMLTGTSGQVNGWMNVVVGVIGAFIGGLALQLMGVNMSGGFSLSSLVTAVVGAAILLGLMRAFRHNTV